MSKLVELELLAQRVWMRSDRQQMHRAVLMILILEAIHQIYSECLPCTINNIAQAIINNRMHSLFLLLLLNFIPFCPYAMLPYSHVSKIRHSLRRAGYSAGRLKSW